MNEKIFEVMLNMGMISNYDVNEHIKMAIGSIKLVREYAKVNNQLDEQWFLDFLDDINKLSIDPDR